MSKSTKNLTGMKKREQIDAANKTVFLWAMAAAAALALCAVVGYFLGKEIIFNGKIMAAKTSTLSTLNNNIGAVGQLETNVKALIANGDLAKVKNKPSDTNYKVVLDALPVSSDPTILGSSLLQEVIPKSGVKVDSLTTMPDGMVVVDVAPTEEGAAAPVAEAAISTIPFSFTVEGDYRQINNMLRDIELSIRPINITRVTLQGAGNKMQAIVTGESYYSSERTVELGTQEVKP